MVTDSVSLMTLGSTDMIIEFFTSLLTSIILQRALLAAVLVAIIAATSGTFMVFRGLSFLT